MPSNRRFDRKKAVTFELVYKPLRESNDGEHSLRRVDDSESVVTGVDESARNEFELGEFGFPDDGYDYSKHFRTIGGTGGVFMAALDAKQSAPSPAPSFQLRENEESKKDEVDDIAWPKLSRRPADEQLRSTSIVEIQQLRRENPDLDEVFAELDSGDELKISVSDAGENVSNAVRALDDDYSIDEDLILPDNFIALANSLPVNKSGSSAGEEEDNSSTNHQVDTPKRHPSVIDEQFDELLRAYECEDDSADEYSMRDCPSASGSEIGDEDGIGAAEMELLLGHSDFNDSKEGSIHVLEAGADESQTDVKFEPDQHAELQLTKAMDNLMDSYKRVSAEEAFSAIDGLDVARRAIKENEELERKRLTELDDAESDSGDSELEAEISQLYKDREQWDCETIISTYSNLDNHPSEIDEPIGHRRRPQRELPAVIRLDPRTQLPTKNRELPSEKHGIARGPTGDFGARRKPVEPSATVRKKGESKEEKRARKAAVKEAARARRVLKSEMKRAFANETLTQDRHAAALGKSKVAVQF